jgi:flagellar hook protein FlgE
MALTLDLGASTQFGDSFSLAALTQDGYTTGRLTGIEVTPDGIVNARYTNGVSTPLARWR